MRHTWSEKFSLGTTFLRNVWRMLDQTMRKKQEGNIATGNRKSALKRGEGKFWEDRKQTLTATTFEQKDHILKKQTKKP